MSLCDVEGYNHDYDLLINKGPCPKNGGRRKVFRQKLVDEIVAKTVYDPENTLSKRNQKRLLADQTDGFCLNVPYSLDKHERWETITPISLLCRRSPHTPGVCVVERDAPFYFYDSLGTLGIPTVTSMHVLDDDAVATFSSGGRKKTMREFTKRLSAMGEYDKKAEAEPAMVQFNIYSTPRSDRHNEKSSKSGSKKRNKIFKLSVADIHVDLLDNLPHQTEDASDSDREQMKESMSNFTRPSRSEISSTTILDHLKILGKALVTLVNWNLNMRFAFPQLPSHFQQRVLQIISLKPEPLINISAATNANHIFEVIDVKLENMDSFDLREEISLLLPPYCTLHWFGERVSVRSKPTDKPFFVIFFELGRKEGILRLRVSTNTPYSGRNTRNSLWEMLRTRRNFPSLFNDLIEFIFSTLPVQKVEQTESRFSSSKDAFLLKYNSEELALTTSRCDEMDMLAYMQSHYTSTDTDLSIRDEDLPHICQRCSSHFRDDLFLTVYGMMCRQCMASFVMHQLRLNRFPLEIPLLSTDHCSILLLHAVLPVPIVSLIIKMSYKYFYTLDHPDALFMECPQCSLPLAVPHRSEFNSCSCARCEIHFCYLCDWEPHWPMTCGEFKEWTEKWDEQYFVEKFNLDKDEKLLKITCECSETFYVPESLAHGTVCPNRRCCRRYDKNGLMRYSYEYGRQHFWQYRVRYHTPGEKQGYEVIPQCVEQKKLIKRKFADICITARKERFNVSKKAAYEEAVTKAFCCEEQTSEMKDFRKKVLFLVENCTAWLYIRLPEDHGRLKTLVIQLLQNFLEFQEEIMHQRFNFSARAEELRKAVTELLASFRRCKRKQLSSLGGS